MIGSGFIKFKRTIIKMKSFFEDVALAYNGHLKNKNNLVDSILDKAISAFNVKRSEKSIFSSDNFSLQN